MESGASSYRRFIDGDKSAFDDIIREHFPGLVFFINRYLHDIHAAEDIAIDVFTELVVHPHRYNFKVRLSTYLYMLGRSRALNYLKRRGRVHLDELSCELPDDCPSPVDELIRSERAHAVHRALDSLPSEMRAAVHLVYFDELTYKEAARVMKKTDKQIDNLIYRAKRELKSTLGKDGELNI